VQQAKYLVGIMSSLTLLSSVRNFYERKANYAAHSTSIGHQGYLPESVHFRWSCGKFKWPTLTELHRTFLGKDWAMHTMRPMTLDATLVASSGLINQGLQAPI